MKQTLLKLLGLLLCISALHAYADQGCTANSKGIQVQVLGSGGPELTDKRASSSYLIWQNGKARILIDIGNGSLFNLEQTDVQINDIRVILLSHLHTDHTADLSAFIKATFFTNRNQDLPLWGPSGNQLMPATSTFIDALFGQHGAYRYLNSYLSGKDSYQIIPHDIDVKQKQAVTVLQEKDLNITAVPVHHGPIPALAWQVIIDHQKIVFTGDMNHDDQTISQLTDHADLLIAHHAVPESATGVARHLHMPPSVIGQIANKAQVKQLVLSHHMLRTLDQFATSEKRIKQTYQGKVHFATDLQCFSL